MRAEPGGARAHERSAPGQPRRRARRAQLRARGARARALRDRPTASTSRRASRSRGSAARSGRRSAPIAAIGILVFFWYGSSLLLRGPEHGGLSQGAFFAFWSAFARMTWPMIALGFALSVVQRGRAGFARLRDVFDAVPEVVDGPRRAPKHVGGSLRGQEPLVRVRRAQGARRRQLRGRARRVAGHRRPHRLGQDDARDAPRAPPADAAGRRAHRRHRRLRAPALGGALGRRLRAAGRVPLLDDGGAQHRLRARRPRLARRRSRRSARPRARRRCSRRRSSLPEGFDTVVGERGVQLSGGQKQRIALARALVWEPKILVLDDPLSAVDAKTESAILDAIERQAAQRTVVLVTHRVAAASRCDRVIVLDEGRSSSAARTTSSCAAAASTPRSPRSSRWRASSRRSTSRRTTPVAEGAQAVVSAVASTKPPPATHGEARRQATRRRAPSASSRASTRRARSGRPTTRACCVASGRSSGRTPRYLVASLGELVVITARQPGPPAPHGRRGAPGAPCATRAGLMRDGLVLAVLLVVVQALTFAQMYAMQLAGARAMADLRTPIFRFFQRLRLRYYDRTPGRAPRHARHQRRRRRERAVRLGRAQRDGRRHRARRHRRR